MNVAKLRYIQIFGATRRNRNPGKALTIKVSSGNIAFNTAVKLNNHRLKTVGLGYGLKARIRID